ncbi:MAG TPA: CHRD domain-containing protein [Solirubrobacteraceae bacterium]|jgi:hypothetical protein|nr:CHRD domain-containing protein [Solirubrobacteraceae bacterium]
MTRIRIAIGVCATIAALAALATASPAADKKLYATMSGSQERPAAGDPDGTGTAVLTVTSRRVCYDIRPRRAGLTFAAAHIHVGARGRAGDVLIPLFSAPKRVTRGRLAGCSPTVRPADLRKVTARPGRYYLNLHNAAYPAGAIRGQLTASRPR